MLGCSHSLNAERSIRMNTAMRIVQILLWLAMGISAEMKASVQDFSGDTDLFSYISVKEEPGEANFV